MSDFEFPRFTTLATVDPGLAAKGCAIARFAQAELVSIDRLRSTDEPRGLAPEVVVERPQIDGRSRTIAPTIVDLAWEGALVARALVAPGGKLEAVTPSQWKGSTHKPQHHARVWDVLTTAERALLGGEATHARIVDARRRGGLDRWAKPGAAYYGRWDGHDFLDAVALGLWYLGRIAI